MKISICIPQYNRIEYLEESLSRIAKQTYRNLEITISDDASSDATEATIQRIKQDYPFPIVYSRFEENQGYDRNLRHSMELASGDYCFVLGNDDTFQSIEDMEYLVEVLSNLNHPEIGFCNFVSDSVDAEINRRAHTTTIIGTGPEVAVRYHKSFSFVAGLIFKRSAFLDVNSAVADGSIYCQIYLACRMMLRGGQLFTIDRPIVVQDIRIGGERANSYRDTLIRQLSDFRSVDAGLPQVVRATCQAFQEEGFDDLGYQYQIVSKIYRQTMPFWLIDYKRNNAPLHSLALVKGLRPNRFSYLPFTTWQRLKINLSYAAYTLIGLLTPVFLFNALEHKIYAHMKR